MSAPIPLLFLHPLPKDDDQWKGKPVALNAICNLESIEVETAGRAYYALVKAVSSDKKDETKVVDKKSNKEDEEAASLKKLKKKLSGKKIDLGDFYGLLGLEEKKWDVTDDEVNTAYRQVSLICHPDKAKPKERAYFETRFKAIQKAFEHLTDPLKKRNYDSSLDFDDAIPDAHDGLGAKSFFKVYRPVFKRNARFSIIKPVPQLGDRKTPYGDVNIFYDFWFGFKSWRDFSYLDEHKLDDASSREEKRWMERQNQKLRAAKKKEETARTRKLVESAMKKDPRVLAEKKREEERKNQKKQQKAEKRRQIELQIERKKQAELDKKAEEERLKKEEKKRLKEIKDKLKRTRASFKKMARMNKLGTFDSEDIELIGRNAQIDEVTALIKAFSVQDKKIIPEKEKKAACALFVKYRDQINAVKQEERRKGEEALAKQKLESRLSKERRAKKESSVWTPEEETMLQKAIVKFPPGAGKRWQKIADMINQVGDKTTKEVIRKAKERSYKKETDRAAAFESYQKKVAQKKKKSRTKQSWPC